jgi:putative ABC transport system permease protein
MMELRPILSALLRSKTGPILVALQVAISLAILANALHIVAQRQAAAARPSGLADESALFYVNVRHLVKGSHEEQLARQRAETAALRAVPGVSSVAWTSQMPMSWSGSTLSINTDRKRGNHNLPVAFYLSPDALVKTLGLKLVEGRDFTPAEIPEIDADSQNRELPPTVIITRQVGEKLWPGAASYVGRTLYFGAEGDASAARVIGVVETLQTQGAELDPRGYHSVITPVRLTNSLDSNYVIRAEAGQRERVIREAENALRASSRTPVLLTTRTVDQDRAQRYQGDRALSWMLVTVSVLLLLITASGTVGMASLWVNQRRKQIGVRRALGARRVDILRYFLLENAMITCVGVAAGLMGALGLNALLVAKLGMARLPAPYMAAGSAVFIALGLVAVYGPAWRASTISPATATRSI